MPGKEAVQQGPCSAMLIASAEGTVQVLPVVEFAVHRTHQTAEHVASVLSQLGFRVSLGHRNPKR